MNIIDRVKWDGNPDTLAWKYPSQELSTFTQLIVNDTQDAFVVKDGVIDGPFGAGRHTLSTENIPLLRKLIALPFGGKTPFSAEVWFVNKVSKLDLRWGTPDPIQVQDPKFGIMVPVRAFGQYGIRIADSRKFLTSFVGTMGIFNAHTLAEYFGGIYTMRIKTAIAGAIVNSGRSVLELTADLGDLSTAIQQALAADISAYGVELTQFSLLSINVPENDPGVRQLTAALARRAEMDIVGYDYQQERSLDILHAAARNEGTASPLLGAGLGAGMGMAIGGTVSQLAAKLRLAPSTLPADRIRLLKELAELRSQNVLTDDEFAAEKQRILAS